MKKIIVLFIVFIMVFQGCEKKEITQDERMQWWRDARFGMFIHWGLYAIPAGVWKGEEVPGIGEWMMKHAKIPVVEYRELAKQFNPVKFDAKAWVKVAKDAGMKYIAITSKHHDGFAMFKSEASKYNIVDGTPYSKDPIKELADECHKEGLKICFYYSQARDWNEPNGLDNNWDFPEERDFQKYLDEKVKPQLTELLTNYGEVGMIWFDTPITINDDQAQQLKDLVRRLQPACILSGRLGGQVETDYTSMGDNAIPGCTIDGDWETPATLNNTWGFKKNDHEWKSPKQLTLLLFDIVSKGGNYLLNVGPDAEGVIPEPSVKILESVGDWMKVNGEAIYGTQESPFKNEFKWGNITQKQCKLFLGFYSWPEAEFYLDGLKNKVTKAYLLSDKSEIKFSQTIDKKTQHHRLKLELFQSAPDSAVSIVALEIEGKPEVETTIFQKADGTIEFQGGLGKAMKGDSLYTMTFGARGGGADGWFDPAITLSWDFYVEKPGKYKIDIVTSETGSHSRTVWVSDHNLDVICGNEKSNFIVKESSKEFSSRSPYWYKIHSDGGIINITSTGLQKIILDPVTLNKSEDGRNGFTFKELRLIPIK